MSETNVGNMSKTKLTELQRFILSSIKKNPLITGKEMSETLSVTQRTVERDLSAMQKAGIIRHEGKVNAGGWVVLEKPQKVAQDFSMSKNSLILVLQKQTRESNDSTASMHSLLSAGYVQEVKESAS